MSKPCNLTSRHIEFHIVFLFFFRTQANPTSLHPIFLNAFPATGCDASWEDASLSDCGLPLGLGGCARGAPRLAACCADADADGQTCRDFWGTASDELKKYGSDV